jgi:lipoprotein-anchoring transpeptidase ErfK/SrfK
MTPSSRFAIKFTAAVALGATSVATAGAAPAHVSHKRVVAASQSVVTLYRSHSVYAKPNRHSHRLGKVSAQRPITGARTVLPVLGANGVDGHASWMRVKLPGRPNGHTGWISSNSTRTGQTPWRIFVSTSRRRVTVYRSGHVVRRFRAVVGKPSTPTPHGRFFVEETIVLRGVGAPYALALSARSNVLQQFDGGPGQIALHGLGGVGGTPGTAVSHGCIRLSSGPISWLAARIGPGVPVTITR